SERITLANTATAEIPVAIAALIVWKPSALTMTTASRKLGIASSTSTSRASTMSTTPPRNPESRPIRPPTTTPITTATSALVTDEVVGAEPVGGARRLEEFGRDAVHRVVAGEQPWRHRPGDDRAHDHEGEQDARRDARRLPGGFRRAGDGGDGHRAATPAWA